MSILKYTITFLLFIGVSACSYRGVFPVINLSNVPVQYTIEYDDRENVDGIIPACSHFTIDRMQYKAPDVRKIKSIILLVNGVTIKSYDRQDILSIIIKNRSMAAEKKSKHIYGIVVDEDGVEYRSEVKFPLSSNCATH